MKYLVESPENLEIVRLALDQANGFKDGSGRATNRVFRVWHAGVVVAEVSSEEYCAHFGVDPTTTVPPAIVADDGSCALELPDHPHVTKHLDKIMKRVLGGKAKCCEEAELPTRLKAELARRKNVEEVEKALGINGGPRKA